MSLLPTIDGRLFKLEAGNAQLPRALLEASGANVTHARVAEVARDQDGSFLLTLRPGDGAGEAEVRCEIKRNTDIEPLRGLGKREADVGCHLHAQQMRYLQ